MRGVKQLGVVCVSNTSIPLFHTSHPLYLISRGRTTHTGPNCLTGQKTNTGPFCLTGYISITATFLFGGGIQHYGGSS